MCYNVIICDDNKYDLNKIINLTKKYFSSKENVDCEIHSYSDYNDDYLKYIRSRPSLPIFLLDIEVPSMSGIDVARIIRNLDVNYPIIYVTGYHSEYAFTVLQECNMLGYINKFENTENELFKKFDEILEQNGIDQFIEISTESINFVLKAIDINYFETTATKNKIRIVGNNQNELYLSLEKLYKQLNTSFIKTHQSCIVNFGNIKEFHVKSRIIVFKDGTSTNLVSRDFFKRNKAWLQECHASKIRFI